MHTRPRGSRKLRLQSLEARQVLAVGAACNLAASTPEAFDETPELQAAGLIEAANDSIGRADDLGVLSGTIEVNGSVSRWDRRDYFRFEIAESTSVSFTLDRLSADADLYLFDSGGRRIAASRQGGTRTDSLAGELPGGEYYLLVQSYRRASTNYRLTLFAEATAPPREDLAGNSPNAAWDLGSLDGAVDPIAEYVGPDDDSDYFRISVEREADLDLGLSGLSADIDLYLLDAQGGTVARSINGGSSSESIAASVEAGTYYVVVVPWQDAASEYDLTVYAELAPPPSDPPSDPPNDPPSNDPLPPGPASGLWHVDLVGAPAAWQAGYTGEGVVVAVVDTGVDWTHPDLNDVIWTNSGEIEGNGVDDDGNGFVDDVRGWNFVDNTANTLDVNGHGTHVAGSIAGENNGFGVTGVAYAAQIMPVQVLGANGSGTSRGVADGIRYAVDNGAQIINLSLGGGFSSSIYAALQYAEANNVLVVAASGNSGDATPGYPAVHSDTFGNTLSVGAHDSASRVAGFSNRVGNSGAVQVDAPGVSVLSTIPGNRYARFSGTSMATPHTAGVAALVWSAAPNLTAEQVRSVIVAGATRSISGSDSIGGVDAAASIPLAVAGTLGGGSTGGSGSGSGSGGPSGQSLAEAPAVPPAVVDPVLASSETEAEDEVVAPIERDVDPVAAADFTPAAVDGAFQQLATENGFSAPAESISEDDLDWLTLEWLHSETPDELFA